MHSAGILSPKDPAFSVSVGVAALILEGRPHQNTSDDFSYEEEGDSNDSALSDGLLVTEYARGRLKDAAQRINEKLQQIRTCPSTSKDYFENTVEIPVGSPSHVTSGGSGGSNLDDDYAERIYYNPKFRNNEYPPSPYRATPFLPYGKSNTRSLYKTVEAWTESNILYTGLEKIKMLHNISPIKLSPLVKVTSVRKKSNAGSTGGPHCEQFLKKIGLVKVDPGDDTDHKCEYISEMCRAWQLNLSKITSILAKNECICIEVFLGPENHAILLEQWTVKIVAKSSQPMMSLQSLCSAIRSQLYFSQIIAWTDQLKSLTAPIPKEFLENPRILKNPEQNRVKLDILFRIRPFDGDSCFNEKPLIHQFPDASITEAIALQVCLRTAPRTNKIPRLFENPPVVIQPTVVKQWPEDRKQTICTEKGKHRCVCDEEESPTKDENLSKSFPMPSAEHREKQLQKYKRRLMKRDKTKKRSDVMSGADSDNCYDTDNASCCSTSTGYSIPCPTSAINSIQTPLYNILPTTNSLTFGSQHHNKMTQTQSSHDVVVMGNANTVGTQTEFCDVAMDCLQPNNLDCNFCGNRMQTFCINCDTNSSSSSSITNNHLSQQKNSHHHQNNGCNQEPHLEKADILLQALERTASVNSKCPQSCETSSGNNNESNSGPTPSTSYASSLDSASIVDCRLCKRQKLNHTDIHALPNTASNNNYNKNNNNSKNNNNNNFDETLPSNSAFYLENDQDDDDDFSESSPLIKPSLSCDECDKCSIGYEELPMTPESSRPKINLSSLFDSGLEFSTIKSEPKAISSLTIAENGFSFDEEISPSGCSTPVQKSSSAPTFNYASASLSPRFCRLATAMYKRRSRHLSDRSSTSEEPLSDEDISYCDTFGRNTKSLSRSKSSQFNFRHLIGSLEESLLQHRILPKHHVTGFKVLLGASGSFCPTQLTVPAVSYFYELPGETSITTPYVSELKLPRKGYCVPRCGTIQATLLNPLGTVVRMFVVPYDFSDMPPTNVSFIRQRVLARDDGGGISCVDASEFEKLSRRDQLRLLRYAIHLRFKTSRSGRLYLHTDVKALILRRPDCDTAAAHANNSILESPNELNIITIVPEPRYSSRIDK